MEWVDQIYQDVAQPNQVGSREEPHLPQASGHLILMLKTRSVDVRRDPADVAASARNELNGTLTWWKSGGLNPTTRTMLRSSASAGDNIYQMRGEPSV